MPYRKEILAVGEYYHVFNRGINGMDLFKGSRDYLRFLYLTDFYRYKNPPVRFSHYWRMVDKDKKILNRQMTDRCKLLTDILCFCLMPNHFHLLLKQREEKGISDFMRNLENSYGKYFNMKYQRKGGLFQSQFKCVRVEDDEQLLHLSRYIHLNPVTSFVIKIDDLDKYLFCSFLDYIGKVNDKFIDTQIVLSNFKTWKNYRKFVLNQAEYQRQLSKIKHLILE